MAQRFRSVSACGLLVCAMVLAGAIPVFTQGAQGFRYVIPRFSSSSGSELVVSNLSNNLVTPQITLLAADGAPAADILLSIPAGAQTRLSAQSFGLSTFSGAVVVSGSAPLSVVATLTEADGSFESVGSALPSEGLIIPFSQGTAGSMDLTLFNGDATAAGVVIDAIGPSGQSLGGVQQTIGPFATLTQNLSGLFPSSGFGAPRDISHVVIRALTNVFGSERRIYAQAILRNFNDSAEGILALQPDEGIVTGVPISSAAQNATIPYFVQGGGYLTMLQVINTSNAPGSVSLIAVGLDGNVIPDTTTVVLEVPAKGSIRRNVQNVFNFAQDMVLGSIITQSSTPSIVTAAIGNLTRGGFVLAPSAEQPNTNFVFPLRPVNPALFVGFAFVNATEANVTLTLRHVPDDGSAVTGTSLIVPPFASLRKTLGEMLPEAINAGFLHVASDVPIVVAALEGRTDNTVLAYAPAMHSQPGYNAPNPSKFVISGTVRHNGAALSGVSVQLSGPVPAATTTDVRGTYFFQNATAGDYTVTVVLPGYTLSPSTGSTTIADASSRDNDFVASLIIPAVTVVAPNAILAGSSDTTLLVGGGPFISTSEIVFEDIVLPTKIVDASVPVVVTSSTGATAIVMQTQTVLQATVTKPSLAVAHITSLFVRSHGPGGSVSSETRTFSVGNPAPTITLLTGVPDPLLIGHPGFTLNVDGKGFTEGSMVQVSGTPVATTLLSAVQVRAAVPPNLLIDGGFLKVTAINPAPTIGPSNEMIVTIYNPIPGVTSISPNSTDVRLDPNALPLQLTVRGFGFRTGAVVQLEAADVPTTFVSSTELVGAVPQKNLEAAKILAVKVRNPEPTLGFSEAMPLSLSNLAPTVTSLDASPLLFDPIPRFLDDKPKYLAQVIIRGTNFTKEGLVYLIGTPCDTEVGGLSGTRVSSTMIIGQINIACTGSYQMGVVNPQPGGGRSNLLAFTVAQYTTPTPVTLSGLAPAAVLANSGSFTLTISGANFLSGAVVNFGTALLFPASITADTIVVTIPGFLIQSAGIVPVSITNPGPTGNSNRILFTVN